MQKIHLQLFTWSAMAPGFMLNCAEPSSDKQPIDEQPVVYGNDDRLDVYAYPDSVWASRAAEFTVALISPRVIDATNPEDVQFRVPTLQDSLDVCADERYVEQPTAAFCSGTLIGPDLVLTAGHCVMSQEECEATRFVFDYYMTSATSRHAVTIDDIYECESLLVHEFGHRDYAVVRLARPAAGRTPALISTAAAAVPAGTPLYVHGFPAGLPMKLDDGGIVRKSDTTLLDVFLANLDTFRSSSGSGVFNQKTRTLVGLLVGGEVDYVWDPASRCHRVHRCQNLGCSGERVMYAFWAAREQCDAGEPAPFCPCGNGICDPTDGESTATCPEDCGTLCGDGACNGSESSLTCREDCTTCGNAVCDPGEDSASCCTDCGCAGELVCVNRFCVSEPGAGGTCVDPVSIPAIGTQTLSGETTDATDTSRPSCAPPGSPEHFYTFTLTEDTLIDAQVSGYDTVLYLQAVCGDEATELACNDDADPPGNLGSRIQTRLSAGTYFLAVDGFGGSAGTYALTVTFTPALPAEPGESCALPYELIASGTQSATGDTSVAANDFSGYCGGTQEPDTVYTFTLAEPTKFIAEVTGYDTVLYLRSVCEDTGSELFCNDNALPPGGGGSRLELSSLQPGTYFLIVDGARGSAGPYHLQVTFADIPPAPGETCELPFEVPATGIQVLTGETYLAMSDYFSGVCGGGNAADQVYRFTLTDRTTVTAQVTGFDTVLYAQRVCGDEATELACNDDAVPPGGLGSRIELGDLAPGTYFLIVDGFDYQAGLYTLTVSFGACALPGSDGDRDGDGVCTPEDQCPNDPHKREPGQCGCGAAEGTCEELAGGGCSVGRSRKLHPASFFFVLGLMLAAMRCTMACALLPAWLRMKRRVQRACLNSFS